MTVEAMEEKLGGILALMARHSCKCMPEMSVSVGHCLIGAASETGENFVSTSRMNKAIGAWLKNQ